MKTEEAITFVNYVAEEALKNFNKVGCNGAEQILMITPGFGIRFDFYPDKTLTTFSSMLKYYQTSTVNALVKANFFKTTNVSVNVVKKELGITDKEWEFVRNTPGRDIRGKYLNGKFIGHFC